MAKKHTRRSFLKTTSLTAIGTSGIASFLQSCTNGTFKPSDVIDCAFRLTDHTSLLNLEYYFINCTYKPTGLFKQESSVIAHYGPYENYMVVRLPQQHVAEQNFNELEFNKLDSIRAISYLSGYSYLVFRILFPENTSFFNRLFNKDEVVAIELTKNKLLDWGDDKLFRLVVRQDLTESLFETKKIIYLKNVQSEKDSLDNFQKLENHYPFQTTDSIDIKDVTGSEKIDSTKLDTLRINKLPKVYGDPITALEMPWRLIISPKLPDSRRYKFKWNIPNTSTTTENLFKLWSATLSIIENENYNLLEKKTDTDHKNSLSKSDDNDITNLAKSLELMILGSDDYINQKNYNNILPSSFQRKDLVALYIKLKILARTDKLIFTPIGATAHIHLKNENVRNAFLQNIATIEWEHIFSFGRDEKVTLTTLCLEADFGFKMIYVETVQRELSRGYYTLIRRFYISPLPGDETEKDFTKHVTEPNKNQSASGNTSGIISKFQSPYQKIRFIDITQKEIPAQKNPPDKLDHIFATGVYYDFEGLDWHGEIVKTSKFQKQIVLIPLGLLIKDSTPEIGELIKNKAINNNENINLDGQVTFKNTTEVLSDINLFRTTIGQRDAIQLLDTSINEYNNFLIVFKKSISEIFNNSNEFTPESLSQLDDITETVIRLFQNQIEKQTSIFGKDKLWEYLFNTYLKQLGLDNDIVDKWIKGSFNELQEISNRYQYTFPQLKLYIKIAIQLDGKIEQFKTDIASKLTKIKDIESSIPNLIRLNKQKIGYAVKTEVEKDIAIAKKSISELETDYMIFEGNLRQTLDEYASFDFFHEFAIIPRLEEAKVFVSTLNKLVNEEIPIRINYAKEYIDNQIDNTVLEIKSNTAQVFAEVKEESREAIRGALRTLREQMPGFNIDIQADYMTYLQSPEKEIIDVGNNLIDRLKDEIGYDDISEELKKNTRDLLFISKDIKETVKDVVTDLQNIDPKSYFKSLGAKLFGTIDLQDILGVGFDLPRTTQLPDRIIYQFSNSKLQEFKSSFVTFKPVNETELHLFISKSLKSLDGYFAYTQLTNFSLGITLNNVEVITVYFKEFKITSAPNQPKKTAVSITNIKLGGPLEFVAKLADTLTSPGNGMRLIPSPNQIDLSYGVTLPSISTPGFNFRNLQILLGLTIPFDPNSIRPIAFNFGLNSADNKFLLSAGIYGGGGHFQIQATPKGIQKIDISIEMGAYASIDLFIGRGEVKLFFGVWFVMDKSANLVKAVAYVICSGSATVLKFITIGVSVLIALTYVKRGNQTLFYGEAVVTYSVKIAFFKKSFSIRYYKEIAGSSSEKSGSPTIQMKVFKAGPPSITSDSSYAFVSPNTEPDLNEQKLTFESIYEDELKLRDYINCFA